MGAKKLSPRLAGVNETLNREISSLLKIKDANPKYLLTLDYDNSIIDGIKKINVIDWLLSN